MDIVIEILLEIYMELMFLVIPENNATKKHIWIAKITAILVVLGIFALVIWGCVLYCPWRYWYYCWPRQRLMNG